jgi:soluble lytic murein transglycosylase-like protein
MRHLLYRQFIFSLLLAAGFLAYIFPAQAEIYIYSGPDGHQVVSDRPLQQGYRLQHRRSSEEDIGRLLAGRQDSLRQQRRHFFDSYIRQASRTYQIDPALVKAVIHVESDFNPLAISPKGARGLMQLMPQTAARYQEKDLFSPVTNINTGVRHLAALMKRYPNNIKLVLAAYNAGEHNVDRYKGIPPFKETQEYVKKVLKYRQQYRRLSI